MVKGETIAVRGLMYYSPIPQERYYRDKTQEFQRHMVRTYGMMALGLAVTFAASLLTVFFLPQLIFSFSFAVFLMVAEVVTVIAFSAVLHRASYGAILGMFFFYAVLNGVSISYIFLVYDLTNVFLCFAAAALSFAIMALLGHATKRDLSGFGNFFIAGLVGIVLLTIVNFFLQSETTEIIVSCLGLILFLGITAFDAQRLRRLYETASEDDTMVRKFSVMGALQLYLDFINIFFYLLRLFGRSKN